jgi:2-polyprenyl-6-methoxyphenol hydroxylase-like FAD-dependent oxidoreductase
MTSADVIVVGAGVAGACAAEVLGRTGISVILVDPRPSCPPLFRAEKLEPDQVQILRRLGLLEQLLPQVRQIREIGVYSKGRLIETVRLEQYGISYREMVNGLLPSSSAVQRKLGSVEHIANGDDIQRVRLRGGEELSARLVVLACGPNNMLLGQLGFRKKVIQKQQSLSFGFSIAKANGVSFPFEAITCHSANRAAHIDYLSLFVMGDAMRANLFTFCSVSDLWVRQFISEPRRQLDQVFPELVGLIGDFGVVGQVETGRIDLYRMQENPQPGVVLVGDAFQNACPSTGMGLSKVLTDVDVLCSEYVPRWLATGGMGSEKVAMFYSDPRKCAVDRSALEKASYRRRAVTDLSLRWRIHRLRLHLGRQFSRSSAGSADSNPQRRECLTN